MEYQEKNQTDINSGSRPRMRKRSTWTGCKIPRGVESNQCLHMSFLSSFSQIEGYANCSMLKRKKNMKKLNYIMTHNLLNEGNHVCGVL